MFKIMVGCKKPAMVKQLEQLAKAVELKLNRYGLPIYPRYPLRSLHKVLQAVLLRHLQARHTEMLMP